MCRMIVLLKSELHSEFVQCDILNSASPHRVSLHYFTFAAAGHIICYFFPKLMLPARYIDILSVCIISFFIMSLIYRKADIEKHSTCH